MTRTPQGVTGEPFEPDPGHAGEGTEPSLAAIGGSPAGPAPSPSSGVDLHGEAGQ